MGVGAQSLVSSGPYCGNWSGRGAGLGWNDMPTYYVGNVASRAGRRCAIHRWLHSVLASTTSVL